MAQSSTNASTSGSGLSRSSGSHPSSSSGLDNNSSDEWQSVPSRGEKNGRSKNPASTSQSNKQTDAWTPRTVGAYHAHQGDNQRSQSRQTDSRPQQSRQTDSRPQQNRHTDSRPHQNRQTENVVFRGVPTPRTVNDRRTALFLMVTEIGRIVAQAQSMQEFELLLSYLYEPSLQPNKVNPRFPIVERTVEERTKIVETIVSYSLWEILTPTSSFGKILAMDLSVHATFASKSKVNEMVYTIFGMATWPRWGRNGRDVVHFPRSPNDVLKTVEALLKLHVSPFRINDKNETIFQTVSVSVSKGNITRETGDAIIAMVLEYSTKDADLMFGCVRTIFADLKRKEPIHFNKSLILLALMNPEAFEKILTALFKLDLDHAGSITVNRVSATFELYLNIEKLVIMICKGEHHPDFAEHFKRNQSLINGLLSKMEAFYLKSLYDVAPNLVEYDVSDGNSSSNAVGTIVFKSLEAFGGLAYIASPDCDIKKLPLKSQVGYLVRSLSVKDKEDNSDNITLLLNLYKTPQLSMTVKILIENAFKTAKIEMKAPVTTMATPKLVVQPLQQSTVTPISLAPPKKSFGKPKVEPKVEPKIEPKPEPKPESKVELKVEPKVESKAESKAESKVESKVEPKAVNIEKLTNLVTGLEKIGSDPIDFSKELPACLDDAFYSLSKLVKEFEIAQVARAFVTNACANLFNDSQIDQLGQLVMYLDKQEIIKKEVFQNLLKNETDVEEILDCTQDDNWRAGDVIDAFKSVCL